MLKAEFSNWLNGCTLSVLIASSSTKTHRATIEEMKVKSGSRSTPAVNTRVAKAWKYFLK